jgi:hypothetical protein
MRAAVDLVLSEGHNPQNLIELERLHVLTMVEGWVGSLNPPSMLVTREARTARARDAGLPLTQTYINPDWGISLQISPDWLVEAGSDNDTGSLYIQNFHSADQFLAEAGGPYVPGDSSLYRIRLYPLPIKNVTTLAEARAGWATVRAEKRITINGLEAIRFDSGALHELEVQLPGRVLNLATMQDPALFEQIIQTLRLLPTPPSTPAPAVTPGRTVAPLTQGRLLLQRGDAAPYELWTVKPDGGQLQRLPIPPLELPTDVIPSPDGRSLLLVRSQHQGELVQRGLELYNLISGQTTSLVNVPARGYGVEEASWSPDGSTVAFTSDAQNGEGVFDIWLVDVKEKQSRALTRVPMPPTPTREKPSGWFQVPSAEAAGLVSPGAHSLQWSPRGDWIAFSFVADARAVPEIILARVADGQVRKLMLRGPYQRDEFTWTPQGDGLLYARAPDCRGTCLIMLNSALPVLLDLRQVIGAWTPDHSHMPFMVWSTGKKVEADDEIWLYDYGRRESRPFVRDTDLITSDQSQWTGPELAPMPWSPDGKWLALIAQRADSSYWTWLAAVDGSAISTLAEGRVVAWLSE